MFEMTKEVKRKWRLQFGDDPYAKYRERKDRLVEQPDPVARMRLLSELRFTVCMLGFSGTYSFWTAEERETRKRELKGYIRDLKADPDASIMDFNNEMDAVMRGAGGEVLQRWLESKKKLSERMKKRRPS